MQHVQVKCVKSSPLISVLYENHRANKHLKLGQNSHVFKVNLPYLAEKVEKAYE